MPRSPLFLLPPLLIVAYAAALAFGQTPQKVHWKYTRTVEDLSEPFGADLLDNGILVVLERGRGRVTLIPQNEARRLSWGDVGIGPGQFGYPEGMAISEKRDVYVADTGNDRVQVFTLEGRFLRTFGTRGTGDGQFQHPNAIAVIGERVYVSDRDNDRVQEFDSNGKFLRAIGGFGSGPEQMNRPAEVDVADTGELYVADSGNHRILRFGRDGKPDGQFGEYGYVPGLLANPTGVFAWGDDVYVADMRNHRLQVFSPTGKLRYQWGYHAILPRQGEGYLHYPNRVSLARDGRYAVVCEYFEDRCQIFERKNGPPPPDELPPMPPSEAAANHYGTHASVSGNLFVLTSPDTDQVLIFDGAHDTPIQINTFGTFGRGPGQFGDIGAVSLDLKRGDLYVCDPGNRRLVRLVLDYKPGGELKMLPDMTRFASAVEYDALRERAPSGALKLPIDPVAMRRDAAGRVWLLDAANCVLLVYSADLEFERMIGGHGPGLGQLMQPTDFALAPSGDVLVVDALMARVNVFDSAGNSRGAWGKSGRDTSEFQRPYGIALNPEGNAAYVTDELSQRVQRFSLSGSYDRGWGKRGEKAGEFLRPSVIVVDPRGKLLVVDHGNHRCQIFEEDGKFIRAFGSRWFVDPTKKRGSRP